MNKTKYCKSCRFLVEKNEKVQSQWCARYSNVAYKIIGHCKINKGKEIASPQILRINLNEF